MNLFDIQLTAAITLFAGTLFCGCLPLFLFRLCNSTGRGENSRLMAFLIYFGGGVLMSTAFLHLLPEATKEMSPHHKTHANLTSDGETTNGMPETPDDSNQHKEGFHIPEFTMLCGFFATFLIDVLLDALLEHCRSTRNNRRHPVHAKFCSCSQRNIECSRIYKPDLGPPQRTERRKRSATWAGQTTEPTSRHFSWSQRETNQPDLLRSNMISRQVPNYGSVLTASHQEPVGLPVRIDGVALVNRQVSVPPQLPEIPEIPVNVSGSHRESSTAPVTTIFTVVALSFHSVFEGIAIGFQTTGAGIWTMFFAVAIHKFVVAFVVGVEAFADGVMTSLMIFCIFVFSIMSPLGVSLTMFLGTAGQNVSDSTMGIVNCIATGALLYVTFYEIFPRKTIPGCTRKIRFWGMLLGFAVMAGVKYASTIIS